MGMVVTELHLGQLQQEAGFLVDPRLATNVVLRKTFFEKLIEGISRKTGLITTSSFSPVPIIDETRGDHIMNIPVLNATMKSKITTD